MSRSIVLLVGWVAQFVFVVPLFGQTASEFRTGSYLGVGTQLESPSIQPGTFLASTQETKAADIPLTIDLDQAKDEKDEKKDEKKEEKKAWYEKVNLRGYAQFRYNSLTFMTDDSAPANYAGDSSIGSDQEFLIRRARLIFYGDVSDHLYLYFQPDFASTPDGSTNGILFAQIRDWYGDVYVDKEKVHRFRVGQSKIPYGWENLQSSQNRLPLDRNDAFNSATRNERDLGVFYYWTPTWAQG